MLYFKGQQIDPTFRKEKEQYQFLQGVFTNCLDKNIYTHTFVSSFIDSKILQIKEEIRAD
jgi:hypothetical protein